MHNHNKALLKIISIILIVEGLLLAIPSLCGVYFGEKEAYTSFGRCAVIYFVIGLIIYRCVNVKSMKLKNRDGYFIGLISWIVVCLTGAVPIFFAKEEFTVAMSIFESVAGWTTTGAWTCLPHNIDKTIIMWKAMTNWIGGIGILLLVIYFFPVLGAQGQKVAVSEGPGIEFSKMSAKLKDTPKFSLYIYIVLTFAELLLLLQSNLPKFDAVVNTMSSIGTAGLINMRSTLVINYSPYVKTVITVFTVLGSLNVMMYFYIATGKFKKVLKNTELRVFAGLLLVSGLIMGTVMNVQSTYETAAQCYGNAFVQACSYGATSGFWVGDINKWPAVCKMILICLVFIGGCGNSTGGGLKVIRFVVYIKLVTRGIYKRIHPRAVKPVMIEGKPVSAQMASAITMFILMFFMLFVFNSIVISLENMPMESAFSTALACMTNNGSGVGIINEAFYGNFSSAGLLYCSLMMLAGRMEMYAVIMVFSRSFWKHDRASY